MSLSYICSGLHLFFGCVFCLRLYEKVLCMYDDAYAINYVPFMWIIPPLLVYPRLPCYQIGHHLRPTFQVYDSISASVTQRPLFSSSRPFGLWNLGRHSVARFGQCIKIWWRWLSEMLTNKPGYALQLVPRPALQGSRAGDRWTTSFVYLRSF